MAKKAVKEPKSALPKVYPTFKGGGPYDRYTSYRDDWNTECDDIVVPGYSDARYVCTRTGLEGRTYQWTQR